MVYRDYTHFLMWSPLPFLAPNNLMLKSDSPSITTGDMPKISETKSYRIFWDDTIFSHDFLRQEIDKNIPF